MEFTEIEEEKNGLRILYLYTEDASIILQGWWDGIGKVSFYNEKYLRGDRTNIVAKWRVNPKNQSA